MRSRSRPNANIKYPYIIFDLDGTLVDSENYYAKIFIDYVSTLGYDLPSDLWRRNPDYTYVEMSEIIFKKFPNLNSKFENYQQLADDWYQYYLDHPIDYSNLTFPDEIETLELLKKEGYILAVASGSKLEDVNRALKSTGIIDLFSVIISAHQCGLPKPDPAVFLQTAEALHADPAKCLVIEDSTIGITAAHQAGMKVFARNDPHFDNDLSLADSCFDTYQQLQQLLGLSGKGGENGPSGSINQ